MKKKLLALVLVLVLCTLAGIAVAQTGTILSVTPPIGDTYGKFNLTSDCLYFPDDSTRPDCTVNFGWNNASQGPNYNGEPAFYVQMENYYATAAADWFEYHLNAFPGTTAGWTDFRPFQYNVNRNDGYALTWYTGNWWLFRNQDGNQVFSLGRNSATITPPLLLMSGLDARGTVSVRNPLINSMHMWIGNDNTAYIKSQNNNGQLLLADWTKIRLDSAELGFYDSTPQPKPTCATPDECMEKLERMGLINYTGNDE